MSHRFPVLNRVRHSILKRSVAFTSDQNDLERLRYIAPRRNLDERNALRLALAKGTKILDVRALENRLARLRQERGQFLSKRDKLADTFAKLSARDSTLLYRYFDLYSQNKALTLNLCGLGLGTKFPQMLDRYLFTKNDRQIVSTGSGHPAKSSAPRTESGRRA